MLLALGLALLPLLRSQTAFAHPLGNFTVNRYTRIELYSDLIRLRYVLDMAEIPTFQEMDKIDLNGDGLVSEEEKRQYTNEKVEDLRGKLRLTVNGKAVLLKATPRSPDLVFLPGQAELQILHLSTWFEAPLSPQPQGQRYSLFYSDDNYSNRIGWKEIVVRPSNEVSHLQSSAPSYDRSDELLNYPQDLLKSPLDVREAQFSFDLTPVTGNGQSASTRPVSLSTTADTLSSPFKKQGNRFASLITVKHSTIPLIMLSLLAAMLWGAMHVLSPGHGKTIVAAYLIGSRATFRHALFLGLTVTVTHTLSVFALGLVTLSLSRYILTQDLFPWLELASGLLVVALGAWLLKSRFRSAKLVFRWRWRQRVPELALARVGDGIHIHGQAGPDSHPHDNGHEYPPGGHTHLPPSQREAKITWRSLLSLGVSGGLLPCPSAMLLMLGAISLDRTGFGLLLVVAFSVGLAGAMTGVGLLALYGRRLFDRFLLKRRSSLSLLGELGARFLPLGSAAVIAFIGFFMTARALTKM
jgi:ABC-type nickel/cobalt efflux system permease component RcnA